MDFTKLKGALKNVTLNSNAGKAKPRILSDVEFLNQEQYEFLEQHTQTKFYTFMQQYWASKLIENNITCTTFEGEVLNVEPGAIRVIDKRWKGASHCICGKAIRYEYWIQHYGPIGSVHITEHTSLDKTLVRDITTGYKKQNELRTDIVKILADLKEAGKTFDDWKSDFDIATKSQAFSFIRNPERRKLIEGLLSHELPLPEGLRRDVALAMHYARQAEMTSAGLVVPSIQQSSPYQYLADEIVSLQGQYRIADCKSVSSETLQEADQLVNELKTNTATIARAEKAKVLIGTIRTAIQEKRPTGWKTIQSNTISILKAILDHNCDHRFAKSLLSQAERGDLSIAQLDTVYNPMGSLNRPGLYYQYESLMTKNNIVAYSPKDYR